MAIQLMSNVKIITSGAAPTVANLLPGQAAFGKLNEDGKYHLFGNTGEGGGQGKVVDIILDTYSSVDANNLESVLTAGNTSTLDIVFKIGEDTKLTIGPSGFTMGETTITADGIKDGGKAVLSGRTDLTISAVEAEQMRTYLSSYSKAEIDAKLASAVHAKGSVNAFADLPTNAAVGDMYNVKTAGGTDIHGTPIKAGDNVVWVAANDPDPAGWDVYAGLVDLTSYYTKDEIDDSIKDFVTEADVATYLTAQNYVKDANYVHTDTNYTATDKAKVNKILTTGDGTKVLTDNGNYDTLSLSVVSI